MITMYGVTFALAFLVVFILGRAYLKNKGKNPELAYLGLIFSISGTIIGARIFYVFYYNLFYFIGNPIKIFYFWEGGLSFHGGVMGAILAGYIFCKKYDIDFLEIADLLVIPTALFLSFGKVANFFNSELYGKITNLPWCVKFKEIEGCRHPVQIYESIKNFTLFLFLFYLKTKKVKEGIAFLSFIFLYTFLRFFIDFFREYEIVYFGLGSGQYLNIITFLVSGYFLFKLLKKN